MNEYITVVQVDIQQPKVTLINEPKVPPPSSFVTVLSINSNPQNNNKMRVDDAKDAEMITVYRLKNERLGFGLKFQGGTRTEEKIERLFIQSCDAGSPASKALASWGCLGEGDEILEIDHEPVTNMTRIECVKALKDKNVAISLLVRKADRSVKIDGNSKRALPPSPPKVPPRKIATNKKPPLNSNLESVTPAIVISKLQSEAPVAAENYLNSLDDDSISDETGSTISSQISVISNFSSESDLSILTKPFQMIEREFNVSGNGQIQIDNLLLFSDLTNNNCTSNNESQRYENIDMKKVPPTPLPRGSIISTMASQEVKSNTNDSKKIETWLNDAAVKTGDNIAQRSEPIKFEYFAAVDDAEEKLGPSSELLNISEAYFNFPWCANVSNASLPTIGEAEEEFSSMEQQRITVNTGPIFIVHDDASNDITETKSEQEICHRRNMEINNINSPYLPASEEDKSDNLSTEKNRNHRSVDVDGAHFNKLPTNSLQKNQTSRSVISENENTLTSTPNEKSNKSVSDHQILISEETKTKLDSYIETEKTSATAASQAVANTSHILTTEFKKMDQSHTQSSILKKGEKNGESRELEAELKDVRKQNMFGIINDALSRDAKLLQKANVAIVAPQRKTKIDTFQDMHFTNSKPPFKSATLGRPTARPSLNWRNKDEKSEKSVKDKIAMFSNSSTDISQILPKTPLKSKIAFDSGSLRFNAKSTENIFGEDTKKVPATKFASKKAMSMENLDQNDSEEMDEINSYTPISSLKSVQSRPPLLNMNRAQSVEHLNSSPIPLLYSSPLTAPIKTLERRISFNGYMTEDNRQKSIANILENRKKNISKLRGLVIPDKVPENDLQNEPKVYDLPVIRSKECEILTRVTSKNISPITMRDFKQIESKSIKTRTPFIKDFRGSDEDKNKVIPPLKPPRTSLITSKAINMTTDESDTSESYSRISSPPISPIAKKPLVRTLSSNSSLSSNSTLTSGSGQASCSSNCSGSVETTPINKLEAVSSNRKLIVASSKSRSGRDCLEKSWRDEDSTDGGIDNDHNKHRLPKSKTRILTNYKLASQSDNLVDKIIKVASYVEVVSSDSEDKNETSSSSSTQKTIMNDFPERDQEKENKIALKSSEAPRKEFISNIRQSFETLNEKSPTSPSIMSPKIPSMEKTSHNRYSSWDSMASSSSGVSSELLLVASSNNNDPLITNQSDFGSFSSFGSSHSLITPQDLQLIIDEADPPLETPEAFVVVLQRENSPEQSIGITLAGGSDYETKEITIHRILTNSPADKDGRLKKGDRILSINGLSMRGLTHRESLSVLKSPRLDVVMVVTRSKSSSKNIVVTKSKLTSLVEKTEANDGSNISNISSKQNDENTTEEGSNSVTIIKDGTGLGISLEGGYDSPFGNKPLIIKKIFIGGAAEKLTSLKANDEIIEINGLSTEKLSRIDVWNMIKRLPQGSAVQIKTKK